MFRLAVSLRAGWPCQEQEGIRGASRSRASPTKTRGMGCHHGLGVPFGPRG